MQPYSKNTISGEAQRLGVAQRSILVEEIVERCITALINEGARLLDEGFARSAADIDLIWCHGYGFPRHRGGPMFYGEHLGRDCVRASMREIRRSLWPEYWTAARWLMPSDTFTDAPSTGGLPSNY